MNKKYQTELHHGLLPAIRKSDRWRRLTSLSKSELKIRSKRLLLSGCVLLLCATVVSCGSSGTREPVRVPPRETAPKVIKAEIMDSPVALGSGRKSAKFVPDNLFGFAELPGGNIGTFVTEGGRPYERFAFTHRTEDGAIITLSSLVRHLSDMKTIHGYEGFRGPMAGKNVWVFRRGKVVAGVIGLPDNEAKVEMTRMAYAMR